MCEKKTKKKREIGCLGKKKSGTKIKKIINQVSQMQRLLVLYLQVVGSFPPSTFSSTQNQTIPVCIFLTYRIVQSDNAGVY